MGLTQPVSTPAAPQLSTPSAKPKDGLATVTISETPSPSFHLETAEPADFPELIRCEWETYESPHQQFFRLYCPIIGDGPNAREESMKGCTERQLGYHLEDPTSYWQKVVDDESGKIIGGALWRIFEKNPFENGFHGEEAVWWPEGARREFISKVVEKHEVARSYFAKRPHVYLNIIFVHPDHRRKGVGNMIMNWGIEKADLMGVEFWLDATIHGKPLYESCGLEHVFQNILDVENPYVKEGLTEEEKKKGEEWRMLDEEMNKDYQMCMWVMWRPAHGKFVDENGQKIKPWEKEEGWEGSKGWKVLRGEKV